MATALLIIHGLVAVALLGAITHQTIAAWVPTRGQRGSFFSRFRAVSPGSLAADTVAARSALARWETQTSTGAWTRM